MSGFATASGVRRAVGLVVAVALAGLLLPAFAGAGEPAPGEQPDTAPPSGPPDEPRPGGGGCSKEELESGGPCPGDEDSTQDGGSQEPLRPGGGPSSASAPAGIADPGGRGNLGLTAERRAGPWRVSLARTGLDAGSVALVGLALLGMGLWLRRFSPLERAPADPRSP